MSDPTNTTGVPAVGEVLSDKYSIERVLGAGGMGVVLAARHATLGQPVAIKFLLPEVVKNHPEAAERFLREARASVHLKSEHVARVLDVDRTDAGAPFMVMEYLEGQDLQRLLEQRGSIAVSEAVEYILQAAEALAEAHAAGIVHRDLKPANLFLAARADGSPLIKVLDFGISKVTGEGERGITSTGAVMGSPGYMAPEQIRSARRVDQRADVWGLGVVLYELLAGAPPFDGDNVATLSAQIVLETPKALDAIRSEIPAALARVVARCLEKDPGQRFSGMDELARALEPFAPPRANASIERITRILFSGSAHAATVQASQAELATTTLGTIGGWENPKAKGKSRRTLWIGGALTLSLAALVLLQLTGPAKDPETASPPPEVRGGEVPIESGLEEESMRAQRAVAGTAVSVGVGGAATVGAAGASGEVGAAGESQAVASSKSSSAALDSKPPRPAKRTPGCLPGQSLSQGHCCPAGLVWLGGRCDRPLATSLP